MISPSKPTAIFFHDGFDARPSERKVIREAIQDSAPALSDSLSPEWIVVRQETGDEPLYVVHYRTQCVTATAPSAEALAKQIRNGVFQKTDTDADRPASSPSSRASQSSGSSTSRSQSPVAEE